MRLISWNVNGIRAAYGKTFADFVGTEAPDVLCLQETKAEASQVPKDFHDHPALQGYAMHWHSAQKKGYSGTAIFTKVPPVSVHAGLGIEAFDAEGRLLRMEFKDFHLYCIYFPNSQEGVRRLPYKMSFNEAVLRDALEREKTKPVILCGDFNVAHEEIDLAHPKANDGEAGFHPEERAWFSRLLAAGYADVWRERNPGVTNKYTWWTYRAMARERNVGWRIDYFVVSRALAGRVRETPIWHDAESSDHCPVGLDLDAS